MTNVNIIPFENLREANLIVDAVYEGGLKKDKSSEVLSKLAPVGNDCGFRPRKKIINGKKQKDVAYVFIDSTGKYPEWRDEVDQTIGRVTYWGDNRKAGNPITNTKKKRKFNTSRYL